MKFDCVLFDCDGVLVDSEAITCGVLRDMLHESGWNLTLAECMGHFVGHTVRDRRALIEAHTGQPLTEDFMQAFFAGRNQQLQERLQPIAGAQEAVADAFARTGGRIACASGADRRKVELQLQRAGLLQFFEGRVFSGHEMPRSKPAPDVYLAAARALGADPQRCLVVEDTTSGVRAGVAAGATVWAYVPPPPPGLPAPTWADLQTLGASQSFPHMGRLPQLWAGVLGSC